MGSDKLTYGADGLYVIVYPGTLMTVSVYSELPLK